MHRHSGECDACRAFDGQLAAAREALRAATLHHQGPPSFSLKVAWAVSRDRLRRQRAVWWPTLTGAGTAAIAVGAILQLLYASSVQPSPEGTAQREHKRNSPMRLFKPGQLNLFDSPGRVVRDPERTDV